MGLMQDRVSVAANATSANVCAGKMAEFVHEPSVVRLYACASAIGLNCTMIVGEEIVLDDQEVGAANRMPLVPDDLITEAGAFPGDRIVVRFRNTTGAAITAFSRVDISPA